ncbi:MULTISPECIES: flagellin [unclassified Simplicispira]|uniref:flagellin N-terminal helical domain-containing protein n=1 Tax=unclassified Simplicispira TaxID=2630407 RepID=UPI000D5E6105|nr:MULTISPECIES: flagellin [unclassified Simplicispira]PVY56968.1 flagellin [Simplicispira sp. 125]REG17913.1 flagellin [Simplicispira sp. 110]
MAATINTNIASLNAQRNLGLSASSLATSMQRLSSGLRVNSAKDDAAGLAISERMNTQVKGLTVAARNANDGISLAQVAEGSLGKVGDMLQRMRELAVQSSNATNSKSDREALQAEVAQLRDEIDRVAKQTTFNGTKILDGSFSGAVFQVGANSGDNITVGALTNTTAKGLASVNYGISSITGIAANAVTAAGLIASTSSLSITVDGVTSDLGKLAKASSMQERMGQVVEAINRKSSDTGITAYLAGDSVKGFTVEMRSGMVDATGNAITTITLSGFSVSTTGFASVAIAAATGTGVTGVDTVDVSTQPNAWVALKKIDSAIDQVNSSRASLGALQSRFESSVANIDIMVENVAASRGRIVDADFAKETANLSRTQILQQAGTAMVAQANQLPQQVLQLLKG